MPPYCTTVWDLHCVCIPKPLCSTTPHRSSLRARPSQAEPTLPSCVRSSLYPDDTNTTVHPHHPLPSTMVSSRHDPSHGSSPSGRRLGTDDGLVASVLAAAICSPKPEESGEERCRASAKPAQLVLPRAVVSKKRCAAPQNLNSLSQGRPM